ncbi:hypothetical protein [Paraburkholderia sp. BCC1885]|uniref:hypothetical protein n=1 Tax=Paraburkholderia sp. BCC1885 TaxID=2562669 RepID=UPI001182CDB8|nr:hypothetical protein [Paraburkholderia sp. BCC1885]
MQEQSRPLRIGNTPIHWVAPANQHTLRIALRLWGLNEPTVKSWINELPTLNGLLSWEVAHSRIVDDADIVVHMVKPSRKGPEAFCWNCVGANRAMVRSLDVSHTEMVLFAGGADQLPSDRSGHWAAAGQLTPREALHTLALMIGASSTRLPQGHAAVRRELLALVTGYLDAAHS